MNRTKDAKQARIILTLRFGTKNFRIGKDGTIRVHGTMPNTNQEGWYELGNLTDPQTRASLHMGA
jgi:hypothetical protein